jgi:transcriptional regulator with XRE-family HTH domain
MKHTSTEKFNVEFGHMIKEARLKRGLTQGEVAESVGVSQVYLSHLELGTRNVNLELALRICDRLGVNIQDFVKKCI